MASFSQSTRAVTTGAGQERGDLANQRFGRRELRVSPEAVVLPQAADRHGLDPCLRDPAGELLALVAQRVELRGRDDVGGRVPRLVAFSGARSGSVQVLRSAYCSQYQLASAPPKPLASPSR